MTVNNASPATRDRDPARLFFALWPDAAVREQLFQLARDFHRDCGGRIMRRENIHLTLVFLGNVERARIQRLEAIAAGQRARCFDLEFGAVGYWRHNRLAWVAPHAVPAPLQRLVAALEQALPEEGFKFDRRRYVPHITLVRDTRAPAVLPVPAFTWQVREFVLVESAHGARGAAYRVLATWALAR